MEEAMAKLTVDDILEELEAARGAGEKKPQPDMGRVDGIIRDILIKRQEEQLRQENRELSQQEQQEFQREIEEQTKNLTQEFERRRLAELLAASAEGGPSGDGAGTPPEASAPASSGEAPGAAEASAEAPKEAPAEGGSAASPAGDPRGPFTAERGHGVHLDASPEEIGEGFGNFKQEGQSEITLKHYKELKNSRNKKVDGFVLEKKEEAGEDENAARIREAERRLQVTEDLEAFEYRSPSQTEEVGEKLRDTQRRLRRSLIVLGALAINGCLLAFGSPGETGFSLFFGQTASPFVYAAIELSLLIAALIAGGSIFRETGEALRAKQPTANLLCLSAVFVCLGANIAYCFAPAQLMRAGVEIYTPLAVLSLLLNRAARYQTAAIALGNFRLLTAPGREKYAVTLVDDPKAVQDMTRGLLEEEPVLVKNVRADFLDGFWGHSFHATAADLSAQRMLAAAIPVSAGLGVLCWFLTGDLWLVLSAVSGGMTLCAGFLGAVTVSLPLKDSQGVLEQFGAAMPSWDAIEDMETVNCLLIEGSALFPAGSIALQGVKAFQGGRVDDAIIDAASVVCAAGSALEPVFLEIIGGKRELLRPVDTLQYEDLMGLSAWVSERRVLVGTRELMINHSIPVPKQEYEEKQKRGGHELIYLATGGELAAAFLLDFAPPSDVTDVTDLLAKHEIAAVVRSVDACVTPELLGRTFGMDTELFKILPSRLHKVWDETTAPLEHLDSMLENDGEMSGYIVSLAAAKRLFSCVRFGKLLSLLSVICGVLLMAALLVLGSKALTPVSLGAYMGIFLLIYWIYEKNMRI